MQIAESRLSFHISSHLKA